jgi:hypothetical protein
MTDEQKHAVEHAQKVLRAVKLYDLAASLGATQGADARPVAISEAMAEALGETGAPHSEAERKLYEAYCKGHCWTVGPWLADKGHYYEMADRIRFAMWRDRASLATRDATPIDAYMEASQDIQGADARPVAMTSAQRIAVDFYALNPHCAQNDFEQRLVEANAPSDAPMPKGWKLISKRTHFKLIHEGCVIASLAGPDSVENAAIIARAIAASAPRKT